MGAIVVEGCTDKSLFTLTNEGYTLIADTEANNLTLADTAGINGIENDESTEAQYFNLQGIKVAQPIAGQLYIKCQGNKTSKVIFQ